jgi:hypothetical protein
LNSSKIDKIIQQLKDIKFNVQDKGQIEAFLGVQISQRNNGTIEMSQPHLIQQTLQDLNLVSTDQKRKGSKYLPKIFDIPATNTVILERDPNGEAHTKTWSYRSVIGKLNYLEKSS